MFLRTLALVALGWSLACPADATPLLVKGSAVATAPFASARLKLRKEGIDIRVDAESNSSAAIAAVGERQADCAACDPPCYARGAGGLPG